MLLTKDSGPKFQTKTTKTPQDLRRGEKFTTAGPRPAALSTKNDKKKKDEYKTCSKLSSGDRNVKSFKKKKKKKELQRRGEMHLK